MQVATAAGDAAGPVVSRSWPQFFERWNASGHCGWRRGGSRRRSWLATLLCHAMQAAATAHNAANTVVGRGCQTFFEMDAIQATTTIYNVAGPVVGHGRLCLREVHSLVAACKQAI